jgi:ribonuclease M5
MLSVKEVIVVEGKYDKMQLSRTVDALIITTDGFGLYKDKQKIDLLRRLSRERGIIILTDSDSAGFRIRNYLRQCLGEACIKHAYIPAISGREKRKAKAGREGLIGVEGVDGETIKKALIQANATCGDKSKPALTKTRFFEDGFAGVPGSAERRRMLAKKIGLPEKISANAMIDFINRIYTFEEYLRLIEEL